MPSRLITYELGGGGMAAPMDMSDSEGGGGRGGGRSSSALSVSRSSSKINKNNLRRAVTQPRPAPQVYKTDPSDFRSLVQQLTGTSPPGESSSSILTPKPLNPRLSKIAPPPLRPTFQYPGSQQHQSHSQLQQPLQTLSGFNPGPRRVITPFPNPLAPQQQRPSNFAVSPLSFSPLPALSPADQIWANIMTPSPLESPGSGAMRQLSHINAFDVRGGLPPSTLMPQAHNMINNNNNFPQEFSRFSGQQQQVQQQQRFNNSQASLFNPPFSPGVAPGYGQFSGFGGQFSPASLAMDNNPFKFPDSDVSRSAFS